MQRISLAVVIAALTLGVFAVTDTPPASPQVAVAAPAAAPAAWKPEKGQHVVIVGSGLADRMQHDGWLEAYVQAAKPDLDLVFRNHGYTGDRIDRRPRNSGFLNADEYLTLSKADVVFAMFGYNESYDAKPAEYQKKLEQWIDQTRGKNYSGKGAPAIVLFSPIAHENLRDPVLPDGKQNNLRLAAYAKATADAAAAKGVGYVDLFGPTVALYAKTKAPLTINGVHLNAEGNRLVARAAVEQLLGEKPATDDARVEKTRQAVIEKNWMWFNRYRATDGNDVWGGRSGLKFTDGQTNRQVLQHELVQLDVMTANRDKRVWAVAGGNDGYKADDTNVPPSIPVISNLANPQKQGGVSKVGDGRFMSPAETLGQMKLAEGMKGNVFASEEMFPGLMVNPVQLGVDTRGRLWAACWKTYPKWEPTGEQEDRLVILPDDNRDGVADKAIVFAQVNNPTGFEFWNGGVIVASAPDILFLKDTDGDDVADIRIRIVSGIDSADTHHTANNFVYGPDGWVYYQRGVFHVSNVETPWTTNQESGRTGLYRFNPRTHEFSFTVDNSPNPHGISFDHWGYQFITDGTGGSAWQVKPDGKGGFNKRKLLNHTVRPVPSSGVLSSDHFPEHNNGNFLICNAIAFLGIKQYHLDYNTDNGDVNGTAIEDLLVCSDPNFRPTDFEIGDDGALYVSDWCNPIVGHMQHNIRDPNRDHAHGRIFRVIYEGRPLSKHVAVDGQPVEKLLDLLKSPVDGVRHRARVELSEHERAKVIAAVDKWVKQFDATKKEDAHHVLEALWVHQQFDSPSPMLLDLLLASPEPHARIAAARVKQFWDNRGLATVASGSDEPEVDPAADAPKDAIVIGTVVEKMHYDKTEITVKAGQKVKILFVNPDFMPHNLVFAQPGSAQDIVNAAIAMGPAGFTEGFIPKHDKIIMHSRLLNHKESQIIEFTAPQTPGDYDYLCTFPGHYPLMSGKMKVVK